MKPFKQFVLDEKAPPSKKAEEWIRKNKEKFKDQYGDDWEQILYATAWKMFGESVNERVWYDQIASWFGKTVFTKDYQHALKTLVDMIDRKQRSGELRHDIDYYAQKIASSYANVDGYELANMYREAFQQQR